MNLILLAGERIAGELSSLPVGGAKVNAVAARQLLRGHTRGV